MSGSQAQPQHSSPSVSHPASNPTAVGPAVNAWSAEYLEAQYQRFRADPASVSGDLAAFFQGFDLGLARPGEQGAGSAASESISPLQSAVEELTNAYRGMGHLIAKIDPFGRERPRPKALRMEEFGLTEADLDRLVHSEVLPAPVKVREVIAHLERYYCGSIGIEFMHIPADEERAWFRRRFEGPERSPPLTREEKLRLLEQLVAVGQFELFLGKRFQGKKRFSIEGGESTIPLLKFMTDRLGETGTQEIVIGMSHRGRLALLRHYLGKDLGKIFTEFKDIWAEGTHPGGGDVKYHRGYSGDQTLPDGRMVHLSLLNNPSHLESQDAVVLGRCRAKQDLVPGGRQAGMRGTCSLSIHGDAALPGQGVVAECLNLQKLDGYSVGGTLHVVINNLIGFTTDPEDSRSTEYCTDIAKIINAPVLHVNGDDPEAVVRAARIAADYRQEFQKDIFVDLVCFRRYGHNEADEPAFTQPKLYSLIRSHPGTPETYASQLIQEGVVTREQADALTQATWDGMHEVYVDAIDKHHPVNPGPPPGRGIWQGLDGQYTFESPRTAVDPRVVAEVCAALGRTPEGFNVHPKLKGMLADRSSLPTTNKIAHNDAEMVAIGTLLLEGTAVRLSGQDSRRGTFTTRHAVLRDEQTNERYTPLDHIREGRQALFNVWDSPLSEYSVMGFDYGYSRANPRALVMWEAQFGDFANGAQIVIDQYLAASEIKWHRWAGLVLLLPHGYEGQGPEHSSARLERFLQLCADENMEVVYPSTGAQTFHMLRRQMLRNFRKPLIVMTPKKFLRIPTATVDELSTGAFQHVMDDPAFTRGGNGMGGMTGLATSAVTQVVYCTGKIFHEMAERREQTGRKDVALIRIEQLYPFHTEAVKAVDAKYPKAAKRVWAQEEPRNQGAYIYIADKFLEEFGWRPRFIGRAACASPATASEESHKRQQDEILSEAVAPLPPHENTADDRAHGAANGTGGKPTNRIKHLTP
ncbi:MAG TPA: 2-oxoglutarate dehydrogenase E1 component [Phycisphaerales bacterium]|nr:2-oxoglutarate dehydrogenase E1 component [Phycisphaerales bacterium]